MKCKKAAALTAAIAVTALCFTACSEMDQGGTKTGEYRPQNNYAKEEYAADTAAPAPDSSDPHFQEIEESRFLKVQDAPLSTFSADVDTASYSYVRRMLEDHGPLEADAIRIEEMINYFHYDYDTPEDGEVLRPTMEVAACPWNPSHSLMRIGVQAEEPAEAVASNFVFLIDVSGSMRADHKLGLVKKSFRLLTEQLTDQDTISIVTYSGEEKVVLEGAEGNETEKILDAVDSLNAGGSTNGSAGMKMAYQLAQEYFIEGGNNRVIMATDGDLNVGLTSREELQQFVEQKREGGVFLSVLGYGTGNYNDALLETVADYGNGSYHYIDGEAEAQKVLCEELSGTLYTVAKDVKLQVEFNPLVVSEYRLIGYENRALSDEDFTDDTKDAGEVGAGHQVTVLYELIAANGEPDATKSLEYQSTDYSESDNFATLHLAYKAPDAQESQTRSFPVTQAMKADRASDSFLLAASVAEFGMQLRGSQYVELDNCEGLLHRLSDIPDAYGFHDLVELAVQSKTRTTGYDQWNE